MEEKNKKILIVLMAVIVFAAISFFFINEKASDKISQKTENEASLNSEKNIKGKVKSVDAGGIGVVSETGEELFFKISQDKGPSFWEKTILSDEKSFAIKEIGLFEIPLDKDVEIKLNSQTNELLEIIVLKQKNENSK
jgi:hypothetical protein